VLVACLAAATAAELWVAITSRFIWMNSATNATCLSS
jgi:hypothetical protein